MWGCQEGEITALLTPSKKRSLSGQGLTNLDTATGSTYANAILTSSNGSSYDHFGCSVSVDGDRFLIGADAWDGSDLGKSYTGDISTFTTLNVGHANRSTDGISVIYRSYWIIGYDTDFNEVTVSQGDTAKAESNYADIFIGYGISNSNTLIVAGSLFASDVCIGSLYAETAGNVLQVESGSVFSASDIWLSPANFLTLEGDYTNISDFLTYLGSTRLRVWDGDFWATVDVGMSTQLISQSYSSDTGYTTIAVIPEPDICSLIALGICTIALIRKSIFGYQGS